MKATVMMSVQDALKVINGELTKEVIIEKIKNHDLKMGFNPPTDFEFEISIDLYEELSTSHRGDKTGAHLTWPMEDWGGHIRDKDAWFALSALRSILGDPGEDE